MHVGGCLILLLKTCSSIWQQERNCGPVRTDLMLCFLCRHAEVNCCATSPFTLQSEVKHGTPHREAFVPWMHSTSGMGMTTKDCV